jgi:uncharacterized protein
MLWLDFGRFLMRAITLTLALGLTLSGCNTGKADPRGVDRDEVLLKVSATGEAETRPDLATFSAGVSSIAASSEAATAANNAKMNKVMAGVEALGVKRDDTQTQALSVGRIDYGRNRGQFEASNTVSVKVRKIDDASKIIAAATAAGANILSGPNLTVDDKEKASLSAYASAFKAAKARAEAYATAAGLKVSRVLTITDSSAAQGPQPFDYAPAESAADATANVGPPIRAGLNTSTAQVEVHFALSK